MLRLVDGGERVTLVGRLDGQTVAGIREQLHAALAEGHGPLVVELSAVDIIDAAGLGMLVAAQQKAVRAGRRIVLRGTPARFARLLRATRLDRVLPDEGALLAA
ncbi:MULTISPECIES: STAS domain-containing protein [unclassified Longispora (in: high G+C Gram-positive bacteria)]|uniref:STAS domain-containing protein n=1 Tax=unclassified Longispora (in: high G+C Gram-positive bacteria) TaxID=2626148 RepID=UPI00343C43C9